MTNQSQNIQASTPTSTRPTAASSARARALRATAIGLAVLVVGIVVTVVTYSHAASSPSGGTYVVAWGPMLFGGLAVVRGLIALAKTRNSR